MTSTAAGGLLPRPQCSHAKVAAGSRAGQAVARTWPHLHPTPLPCQQAPSAAYSSLPCLPACTCGTHASVLSLRFLSLHCPPCRFIVENYNLRFLLTEVPEKDRLHPVALPAFPSTAPTGHVRRQVRWHPGGLRTSQPACGALSVWPYALVMWRPPSLQQLLHACSACAAASSLPQ